MPIRNIRTILLVFVFCSGAATAQQVGSTDSRPTIYNHVTDDGAQYDQAIRDIYKGKFVIVDVKDSPSYTDAHVLAGGLPKTARTDAGELLSGYVAVAYIVSAEGLATEPQVLKSTDPRLAPVAFKAMTEWRFESARLNGKPIATTAIQEIIFKKPEVVTKSSINVPDGFVLQVMEPLGGKIARPRDWFYSEDHRGPSFTWILSKEDSTKGRYETGVRIQTLVGVQKGTGRSPKDFVLGFIEGKKKEASRVIKSCDAKDQGLFTRVCLETEEGDYHILYSAFWGNDNLDVVVVSTAGAKKGDWPTYSPIFDTMGSFELIDMDRFEKGPPIAASH
jgi:hypothetical protein